jgi:hypothetical protein
LLAALTERPTISAANEGGRHTKSKSTQSKKLFHISSFRFLAVRGGFSQLKVKLESKIRTPRISVASFFS